MLGREYDKNDYDDGKSSMYQASEYASSRTLLNKYEVSLDLPEERVFLAGESHDNVLSLARLAVISRPSATSSIDRIKMSTQSVEDVNDKKTHRTQALRLKQLSS